MRIVVIGAIGKSYTLFVALCSELPVVALDLGAIAGRIREFHADAGWNLFPLHLAGNPEQINTHFVDMRPSRLHSATSQAEVT